MKIKNFKLNSTDQVIVKITGEVLRAFHIEVANEYEPIDYDKFEIVNEINGEIVKTRLFVRKNGVSKKFTAFENVNPNERYGAEVHRLIKKNLYKILTEKLKLAGVPYGIMHGVRPTKIIHRWLRDGFGVTSHGVFDRDRISRRLRADYLTSYDKAQLLTEVAIRQIPILNSGDEKTIGVYVGIPFCVTRCLYCSFPSNVLPNDEKVAEFMDALTKDIDAAAAEIQRYDFKVQSIYIGGGTPTALPEKFFAEMMTKVTAAFYSASVEEFTVECGRPDTITPEKISVMKDCRVSRVSVNPQTMQQKTLDRIGRKHTVEQIYTAFKNLRESAEFEINMDLILGLPGETLSDVKDSLKKVLDLNPDDITLHALAIKRGSQLQTQIADEVRAIEDFDLPLDEEVREMAEVAERMLRGKNYQPYYLYRQGYISGQIENIGYCKRGAEGIYNVQIMDERQTILGIGAAATTKVPDNENLRLQTSFNAKDLTTYLRDVDKYIENRSNTLAEVYTPSEKFIRHENAVIFDHFLEDVVAPVEYVEPAEKISEPAEDIQLVDESVEEIESAEDIETAEETTEKIETPTAEETAKLAREEVFTNFIEEMVKPAENIQPVTETETVENIVETAEEIVTPVEETPAVEETAEEIPIIEEPVAETKTVDAPAKMTSDEIFNQFLEEVAEPVEEITEPDEDIVENIEDIELVEEIQPVEEILKPAENIIETAEKIAETVAEIVKPAEEIITSSEKITETVEEVQPVAEIVKPAEDIAKTAEKITETVEEVQPAAEIVKPVEKIVEHAENIAPVADAIESVEEIGAVGAILGSLLDMKSSKHKSKKNKKKSKNRR